MIEIWRDIKDYEGLYQVSNLGRVKSLDHKRKGKCDSECFNKGRILKQTINHAGYLCVALSKNGVVKHYLVHRLVAEAFVYNPDPVKNIEVDHLNTNPSDNRAENLEWVDRIKNRHNPLTEQHNIECRLGEKSVWYSKYGSESSYHKPVLQLDKDSNFIKEWECAAQVERELNILKTSICNCLNGRAKSAGGFIWRYKD